MRVGFPVQTTWQVLAYVPYSAGGPNAVDHQLMEQIHTCKQVIYNKAVTPVFKPRHHPLNNVVPKACSAVPVPLPK
jgi:hypothetical protein